MAFGVVGGTSEGHEEARDALARRAAPDRGEKLAALGERLPGAVQERAPECRETLQRLLILGPRKDTELAVGQRDDVVMSARGEQLTDEARRMDQRDDMLGPVAVERTHFERAADESRAERILVARAEEGFAALQLSMTAEFRKLATLIIIERSAGRPFADGADVASKGFASHGMDLAPSNSR